MATGHTHPVINGEITTLSDFAYECSKSFVWSWRDGNSLAYPDPRDDYYKENLSKAVARLNEWDGLDEAGKYAKWSDYAIEMEQRRAEAQKEAEQAAARITPLLDAAQAVEVPETHKGFKQFMISQLEETLGFDGAFRGDYYKVQPYSVWVDSQRAYILRDLTYYTEQLAKEEERIRESREWISTLASLFNLRVEEPVRE